jgi:hypothetical protein
MTQGHMDRSGGGGVSWHALLCDTSIAFLSRPASVVICMTDDDFARVVTTCE